MDEEPTKRVRIFPHEVLSCLLCGETGFKNIAGHVFHKHDMNGEEYRKATGYEGPLVTKEHARMMATKSNALWDDPETREKRVEGVKKSYTDNLRAQRSSDTQSHWDSGVRARTGMTLLRNALYLRANSACERCKKTEEQNLAECGRRLELHHLNYDKYLPTIDDVQLLCGVCHKAYHSEHKTRDQRLPKIAKSVGSLLSAIGVDLNDENYVETPARVAAYLQSHFISQDEFDENIEGFRKSVFPSEYSDMVVQAKIPAFGMCPHHLLPVIYSVAIAYIPDKLTIGLSKLPRIADLCMRPPMLQETATLFLVDTLQDVLRTPDVAVSVAGRHMCMAVRGVKNDVITRTSKLRGCFMEEPSARSEFYTLVRAAESVSI